MTPRRLQQKSTTSRVRTHWFVLGALVLALGVALLVQGYTHHLGSVSDDSVPSTASTENVPPEVHDGGPVIDASGADVRTAGPPEQTIALTFDDGPDPTWTPRILEVLERHDVHATFFVVGTAAIDHPDLVRRMVDEGHEIGVHTLTHVDLGSAPPWQQELELQGSQQAIVGITGSKAALMRPPYSSENEAVTDGTWSAIRAGAEDGYLTVLTTLDSEDWRRPGVEAIQQNLTPTGSEGQIVLMHDGGGDRSETVDALDEMLTRYDEQGYRVTTVGDALGVAEHGTGDPGRARRRRGLRVGHPTQRSRRHAHRLGARASAES